MRLLIYAVLIITVILAFFAPVSGALLPIPNTSVTIPTVTISAYETIMLAVGGTGNNTTSIDWLNLTYQLPKPWYSQLGPFAYLIMAMIPFSMMWIRTSSTMMAVTLALILGAFFFSLIPAEFASIGIVIVIVGIAARYFYFYKKRS